MDWLVNDEKRKIPTLADTPAATTVA